MGRECSDGRRVEVIEYPIGALIGVTYDESDSAANTISALSYMKLVRVPAIPTNLTRRDFDEFIAKKIELITQGGIPSGFSQLDVRLRRLDGNPSLESALNKVFLSEGVARVHDVIVTDEKAFRLLNDKYGIHIELYELAEFQPSVAREGVYKLF